MPWTSILSKEEWKYYKFLLATETGDFCLINISIAKFRWTCAGDKEISTGGISAGLMGHLARTQTFRIIIANLFTYQFFCPRQRLKFNAAVL